MNRANHTITDPMAQIICHEGVRSHQSQPFERNQTSLGDSPHKPAGRGWRPEVSRRSLAGESDNHALEPQLPSRKILRVEEIIATTKQASPWRSSGHGDKFRWPQAQPAQGEDSHNLRAAMRSFSCGVWGHRGWVALFRLGCPKSFRVLGIPADDPSTGAREAWSGRGRRGEGQFYSWPVDVARNPGASYGSSELARKLRHSVEGEAPLVVPQESGQGAPHGIDLGAGESLAHAGTAWDTDDPDPLVSAKVPTTRGENGRKRSENTKTITVSIFFIGNEIGNGNFGNENDIGISEISESKARYGKYIGTGRNLKYNR
jgi:hypothetical protein